VIDGTISARLVLRKDLARKPSRLHNSSPTATPGLSAESPHSGALASTERGFQMSPTTGSYDGEGAAERRAQKKLTETVGVPLVQRDKSHNLKWRTWTWRLGLRRGVNAKP
jgi:hypothetical protein